MFLNRYDEMITLKSLLDLDKASIAVCKGRRRIGKKSKITKQFYYRLSDNVLIPLQQGF